MQRTRHRAYRRALYRREANHLVLPVAPRNRPRKDTVDRWPMALWIQKKAKQYGDMERLARKCGIHPRRLYTILNGYYWSHGKFRLLDGIHISTVDAILTAEGSTSLNDLYPN